MPLPWEAAAPLVGLAPMAGVTDAATRVLCFEQGAAWAVSEMLSAKGWVFSAARARPACSSLAASRSTSPAPPESWKARALPLSTSTLAVPRQRSSATARAAP